MDCLGQLFADSASGIGGCGVWPRGRAASSNLGTSPHPTQGLCGRPRWGVILKGEVVPGLGPCEVAQCSQPYRKCFVFWFRFSVCTLPCPVVVDAG